MLSVGYHFYSHAVKIVSSFNNPCMPVGVDASYRRGAGIEMGYGIKAVFIGFYHIVIQSIGVADLDSSHLSPGLFRHFLNGTWELRCYRPADDIGVLARIYSGTRQDWDS